MTRRSQIVETSLLALTVACVAGPASAQTALPDITVGTKKPAVHHAPQPTAKPQAAAPSQPTRAAAPAHASA
ncbi:MAG: hypothetical protein WAK01_06340, partial [Methylocystis sp.]